MRTAPRALGVAGGTGHAVGCGRLTLPVVMLPFVDRDPQLTAVLSLILLAPPLLALAASHRLWRR